MGKAKLVESAPSSGIKVLDRAVLILNAVADGSTSLSELCDATSLPRATTHRLATALETHNFLMRTNDGRWSIGTALRALSLATVDTLTDIAEPIMADLVNATGESVQLYRLTGSMRTCIASQEPSSGLQNMVPVGYRLTLSAGSAARVFVAYSSPSIQESILRGAQFSRSDVKRVTKQGWAASISEREVGLASVSAPVFDESGELLAVLSVSGVADRFRPDPGEKFGQLVVAAARRLSDEVASQA